MIFSSWLFFQKTNEQIRLYYLSTCFRLFFGRRWRHQKYTSKLIDLYLPSGLFVVVSWVSFLIPPEVVPGRMALLVTLFLVLINIFNTITNISQNTEAMTAIASWMIACMFFVFGALLAYATILYFLMVSSMCVCWCLKCKFQNLVL